MELKDYLTNEKIKKKFTSQFDLVNYAIKLATNMIHTGRDSRVKIDSQNRAMQILSEILQGKDQFDEILIEEPVQQEQIRIVEIEESPKGKERKKNRKILVE